MQAWGRRWRGERRERRDRAREGWREAMRSTSVRIRVWRGEEEEDEGRREEEVVPLLPTGGGSAVSSPRSSSSPSSSSFVLLLLPFLPPFLPPSLPSTTINACAIPRSKAGREEGSLSISACSSREGA